MTAPTQVHRLIERFERDKEFYLSDRYNETQLRREYLDPFFHALGWDMDNRADLPPAYREVIHEDQIKVLGPSGGPKAPDYCFRVEGKRAFFLEAKRPSVNIKMDSSPAYQLRRYAWSSKLPLSILSDFQEFAVYDCRARPSKNAKASTARTHYIQYQDYADRWDEIAALFSRDAVRAGSLDRIAETLGERRGQATVDIAFLAEIEAWRSSLARILAMRNPTLTNRELNYAVQTTIDRIVFLRICEDRGIEPYGTLRDIARTPHVYERLRGLFVDADAKFNSGLFHFAEEPGRTPSDTLSLSLHIDDDVLKPILSDLYYPDSPYEFSVLPADILGQVYEQFLGKVIRLTPAHRAVVEDKPEVKKAGGVYYTPTYIVDHLVSRTLGVLLDGKKPSDVRSLKILDPACGSGSFLVAAYRFLLEWHRDWYVSHNRTQSLKKGILYQAANGDIRLTTPEKKRILTNSIFGVDIDVQAVEVAKLSLLLKVLEEPSQLELVLDRVLPDLGQNVKCGNSLIGPDIFSQQQETLFDDVLGIRVNAFDWALEFPTVISAGGFDVVIGNPPYIFSREQIPEEERRYYTGHYSTTRDKQNTFMLFMELALRLVSPKGRVGFIVPNSWLTIESASLLRDLYTPHLEEVVDLNYPVFSKVGMEPCLYVASGSKAKGPVATIRAQTKDGLALAVPVLSERGIWAANGGRITLSRGNDWDLVLARLQKMPLAVGDAFDVHSGLQAYEKGRGTPPQTAEDVAAHVFDRRKPEDANSLRYLQGRDVARYCLSWSGMWMQYGTWLSQPREKEIFERPRVLVREITSHLPYCIHSVFVDGTFLNNKSILNLLHRSNDKDALKCLAAILNSSTASIFYKAAAVKSARSIFPKLVVNNLAEFPYPGEISPELIGGLAERHDQALALRTALAAARTPHECSLLQRQIDANDSALDRLVYTVFQLSDAEVAAAERIVRTGSA